MPQPYTRLQGVVPFRKRGVVLQLPTGLDIAGQTNLRTASGKGVLHPNRGDRVGTILIRNFVSELKASLINDLLVDNRCLSQLHLVLSVRACELLGCK